MEEPFKGRFIICRKPFSAERMRVQKRMEEDAEIEAELEKRAKEFFQSMDEKDALAHSSHRVKIIAIEERQD